MSKFMFYWDSLICRNRTCSKKKEKNVDPGCKNHADTQERSVNELPALHEVEQLNQPGKRETIQSFFHSKFSAVFFSNSFPSSNFFLFEIY